MDTGGREGKQRVGIESRSDVVNHGGGVLNVTALYRQGGREKNKGGR